MLAIERQQRLPQQTGERTCTLTEIPAGQKTRVVAARSEHLVRRTACTDGAYEASKTGLFSGLLNFVLHARFIFALKDPVVTPMRAISPQQVKHEDFFVVPVQHTEYVSNYLFYYRHSREF
jgi:hypothetical protein